MDHRTEQRMELGRKTELGGKLKNVLDGRTLGASSPRLAGLLKPGMRVLDAGCGTGAITRGIAEAVGPSGRVLGLDSHAGLIADAIARHGDVPGLSFAAADVYSLPADASYDIVAASRLLIWLADPERAIRSLAAAVRPGGKVVIADYNHDKIEWSPSPPDSMRRFYAAYLKWRTDAGLHNGIADRLADLMAGAGLEAVEIFPQHEQARRGQPDFVARASIWADTAASRGPQMARDGYTTTASWERAETEYRRWCGEEAESMTMYMLSVEGTGRE